MTITLHWWYVTIALIVIGVLLIIRDEGGIVPGGAVFGGIFLLLAFAYSMGALLS